MDCVPELLFTFIARHFCTQFRYFACIHLDSIDKRITLYIPDKTVENETKTWDN